MASDPRPVVEVTFSNGARAKALVDTGSTVTLIRDDVFRAKNLPSVQMAMRNDGPSLAAANNSPIEVHGIYEIRMSIADRWELTNVYVVPRMASEMILGMDVLKKFELVLDLGQQNIKMKDSNENVRKVKIVNGMELRPKEEGLVEVEFGSDYISKKGEHDVVIDEITTNNEHLVRICSGCYVVKDGKCKVLVRNDSTVKANFSGIRRVKIDDFDEVSIDADEKVATIVEDINCKQGIPEKYLKEIRKIDLAHLGQKDKEKFLSLFMKYYRVFSTGPGDVGKCDLVPHHIQLKDPNTVVNTPQYRIPQALHRVVDSFIENMLRSGVIQKSTSPFCSPLLLVKKPHADPNACLEDQYRIVADFRLLNSVCAGYSYPMRNIYELLDEVAGCRYLSTFDLKDAFFSQVLDEESRPLTAFTTNTKKTTGSWQFCRTPQGIKSSPGYFQALINAVLAGTSAKAFVDDAILATNDIKTHYEKLEEFLDRLSKHNLKISASKVQLLRGTVKYLGYEIKPGVKISPSDLKLKTIENWKPPRTLKEVRQFIGLCSFFRRLVKDFAKIAKPLNELTKKHSKFRGELPDEAKRAFNELKAALMSKPCVQPVDFDYEFEVIVDASDYALGAILAQTIDGQTRVNAYASRILNEREQKYSTFHREHLAMLFGCKQFKPYLVGRHFTLFTDQKSLLALNTKTNDNLIRIQVEMEEFLPYTIKYIKGSENVLADALSRVEMVSKSEEFSNIQELRDEQNKEKLNKIVGANYNEIIGLWEWNGRIIVPTRFRSALLKSAHSHILAGHQGLEKSLAKLREWWWPSMKDEMKQIIGTCEPCIRNVPRRSLRRPLREPKRAEVPFEIVHTDVLQLPRAGDGCQYLLVIICSFSKWTELVPLRSKSATDVAKGLVETWITRFGVPKVLVSDRGSEFINELFKSLQNILDYQHVFASVAHPQANGQAERVNRSILEYLRKFLDNNNWTDFLPFVRFCLNSSVSNTTNESPFVCLFLRPPIFPYDAILNTRTYYSPSYEFIAIASWKRAYEQIIRSRDKNFIQNKNYFDKSSDSYVLQPGDFCVSDVKEIQTNKGKKFQSTYSKIAQVVQVLGPDLVEVRFLHDQKLKKLHMNNLKLVPQYIQKKLSNETNNTYTIEHFCK